MDDNEARYLIDQYNKYVSWRIRRDEVSLIAVSAMLACAALVSSTFALLVSSVAPFEPPASTLDRVNQWAHLITLLILLVMATLALSQIQIHRTQNWHKRRLARLEEYRFRHKSLPDSITFSEIVDPKQLKEKQLREELERAERSIMQRGHL